MRRHPEFAMYASMIEDREMRFFNTAGPVRSDMHYCVPPLTRFDLDGVLMLIDQGRTIKVWGM